MIYLLLFYVLTQNFFRPHTLLCFLLVTLQCGKSVILFINLKFISKNELKYSKRKQYKFSMTSFAIKNLIRLWNIAGDSSRCLYSAIKTSFEIIVDPLLKKFLFYQACIDCDFVLTFLISNLFVFKMKFNSIEMWQRERFHSYSNRWYFLFYNNCMSGFKKKCSKRICS